MSKQAGDAVITAEYRLLNALVMDDAFRNDSRIHKDLFVHEVARSIFEALEMLDRNGIPVTEASLFQAATELDFNVTLPVVNSIYAIDADGASVLDDILATLNIAVQKQSIQEKLREMIKLSEVSGAFDADAMTTGLSEIDSIMQAGLNKSLLKNFDTWSTEYMADLRERSKGKRYSYCEDNMDRLILKGAYPGAITTIAAGTGQGKSTFVLNMINSCINLYVPCMYVTLEMSGIDTYDRLIALRREIPMEALYANDESLLSIVDMVEEERKSLEDNKNFYIVDEPSLSLARLKSLIKEFKQRSKSDYALVAVDLVTQVTDFMSTKSAGTVANSMELAMNTLNAMAKELNVHFIAVVQFNREADNYKVSTIEDLEMLRPTLNSIKNSGAIAERSRVVISLFRKKYYSDRYLIGVKGADTIPDIMEMTILKSSSGPVGNTCHYFFEGQFFRCAPMTEEDEISLARAAEAEELDIAY